MDLQPDYDLTCAEVFTEVTSRNAAVWSNGVALILSATPQQSSLAFLGCGLDI
jgi:hypothetical protein